MKNISPLIAAIEAGGTKFVCAVAREPDNLLREVRFPTSSDPEATLSRAVDFFQECIAEYGAIQTLGIGTFGPADVHVNSPGYGSILTTPKAGWKGFNLCNFLRKQPNLAVPIAFDTDVNAAVLAEAHYGAARNCRNVAYLTIGTGIGGGFLTEGEVLHGRMHLEIGHITVPDFEQNLQKQKLSVCPFHDSCWEGRASGPAIKNRWGVPGEELPPDHEAWDLEARYLAAGCQSITAAWSPDVIILGGGVPQKEGLIEKVRREFIKQTGEYWSLPEVSDYLVLPELDQDAGIVGALLMAERLATCETD